MGLVAPIPSFLIISLLMNRILAKDLPFSVSKTVLLRGWLNATRSFGKLTFILLRDRSGIAQIVVENPIELKKINTLQPGSVLKVTGKVVAAESLTLGAEIQDPEITIESAVQTPLPIEYSKPEMHNELDFILDHRALALRNRSLQAVFRIQAQIVYEYKNFMHDQIGAIEYFGPNLLGASSEGGAEYFNVDYFNHRATLAQSSQLYKQIMVGVNERVFGLMPFFRAEPSQTTRHISEGKQLEFEMGFFDHWHELLDIQENCIKSIITSIQKHCAKELEILEHPLALCPANTPFPRLSFTQAQELYYKRTGIDERDEPDLSPAAEREISIWARETKGTDFVFILDWKTEKRPFYSYPNDSDPAWTNTFDLLCSGIEITSGGQRRHTYDSMVEGIRLKGMDPNEFSDYLSIFLYGMPPHGGFGMGLERFTMALLRLKNIREASLFPSDTKRIASKRIKAKIFFGGENIRNEIIRLLRQKECDFQHISHELTSTSHESSQARNTTLEEGIKSIIIRGKSSKKNYQFNLPANCKLDMKACANAVGEKCEFETPELILERFGLLVGGVPPFGNLLNLDNYFDEGIFNQKRAAFNCGMPTESIILSSEDLLSLCDAKLGAFAKAT